MNEKLEAVVSRALAGLMKEIDGQIRVGRAMEAPYAAYAAMIRLKTDGGYERFENLEM